MHPTAQQFGTDVERVAVKFRDFLQSLRKDKGPYHYLTTQYAEHDPDALTVLPPPADALEPDFPRVPRLMGNLCLQQVNLWIGRSKDGSTSGLHHDFHDNLYCLLKGRKRFVLFPPSEIQHLYSYGKLDVLHDNGLISYTDAPVRSDGLPVRVALKAKVKALEEKLDAAPKGKGKARVDTKERQALIEAYEQALDELAQYTLDGADGIDADDEVDDFDALMAGLGEDDGAWADEGALREGGVEEEDSESSEEEETEEYPEWNGINADSENEDQSTGDEPPSFSRIPTALVHNHLGLSTTAVSSADKSLDAFPKYKEAIKPFVVELSAGEMLYLPASWWHEVTSTSTGTGDDAVHMAFNYWFYPPNRLDNFDQPYEDSLVWEYIRATNAPKQRATDTTSNKRKKSEGEGSLKHKKSKKQH